jgi:hypothetical protein
MAYEDLSIIKGLINNPGIKKKTQKDTEDDLLRTSLVTITDPISEQSKSFSSTSLSKDAINDEIFPFFEDENIRNYVVTEANQNNFLCAGRTQLITSFNAAGITFPNPREEKTSVEFIKNLDGSYTVKETVELPRTFNIAGNSNTLSSADDSIASATLTSTISFENGTIKHSVDGFSFTPKDPSICDKVLASPLGASLAKYVDGSYQSQRKDDVDIRSVTWNVGGKTPPSDAVAILAEKLKGADVIAIGTQEENGKDKDRLHEQLLRTLNESITLGGQYRIVEVDGKNYRHTTAGGVLSGKQHTRTTIIVKEPYDFDPAPTVTVVDDLKSQKSSLIPVEYNKTIIDISGTLKALTPDGRKETIMDVSIASGHMESNAEKSRRNHTDSYLDEKGMLEDASSFDEIVKEASRVSIFMGDTNERDYFMADGSTQNPGETMNLKGFGFDTQKTPISTSSGAHVNEQNPISIEGKVKGKEKVLEGVTKLEGSYGVTLNDDGIQEAKKCKKNKDRPHVTEGGHLDRVSISTGRNINDSAYETVVDGVGFNKKGKIRYWGSDHAPVIRSTKINTQINTTTLVANFINSRIPDFPRQLASIQKVQEQIKLAVQAGVDGTDAITEGIKSIRLYDDKSDNATILKKSFGIEVVEPNNVQSVLDNLATVESKLQVICDSCKSLKETINSIAKKDTLTPDETTWLVLTYNNISSLSQNINDDALNHNDQNEIFANSNQTLQDLISKNPTFSEALAPPGMTQPTPAAIEDLNTDIEITSETIDLVKQGDLLAAASLNKSLASSIKQLPKLLDSDIDAAKDILESAIKSFDFSFDNSYKAMNIGILNFIQSSSIDEEVKSLVKETNDLLTNKYSDLMKIGANGLKEISSIAYRKPSLDVFKDDDGNDLLDKEGKVALDKEYFNMLNTIVPIKDIPPLIRNTKADFPQNPLHITIDSNNSLSDFVNSSVEDLIERNDKSIYYTARHEKYIKMQAQSDPFSESLYKVNNVSDALYGLIISPIRKEISKLEEKKAINVALQTNPLQEAISICEDYNSFIFQASLFIQEFKDLRSEEGINEKLNSLLEEAGNSDHQPERDLATSISTNLIKRHGKKSSYVQSEITDAIDTTINNKTFAFVNNDLPKISEQVIKKEPKFVTNFKRFINKISQFFTKKDAFVIYEDKLNTLASTLKANSDTPEVIATPNTPESPDSSPAPEAPAAQTPSIATPDTPQTPTASNYSATPDTPQTPVSSSPSENYNNAITLSSMEADSAFATTSPAYSSPETPDGSAFSEDLSLQIGEYGNSLDSATSIQKEVDSQLSEKAKGELYKRTSPTDKTKAREDFISYLEKKFDSMPKCQASMGEKVADPQRAITSIKELFAGDKKGIQLFERAIAEEKTSKDYRNAVFLASHKSCGENKWKDRLAIMVSAPSGSGKSFLSQKIFDAIDDTINGGQRKTFNEETGVNSVIVVDGDIERELSQVRQLMLQTAAKKGFSGIKDLQNKTDAGFKIKDIILATAKAQPNFNICVNTSHDKHYFSDMKKQSDPDALPLKEVLVTLSGSDPKKAMENAMLAERTNALLSSPDDFAACKTQQIDLHGSHVSCSSKEFGDSTVYEYGARNAAASTQYFTDKINKGASNRVVINLESDIVRVKYTNPSDPTKIKECSPKERSDLIMSAPEFRKYNQFVKDSSLGMKSPTDWLKQHRSKNPGNLTIKSITGERNLNKLVEEPPKEAMTNMLDRNVEQKMSQIKSKIANERELAQRQKSEDPDPEDPQQRLD